MVIAWATRKLSTYNLCLLQIFYTVQFLFAQAVRIRELVTEQSQGNNKGTNPGMSASCLSLMAVQSIFLVGDF